MEVMDCEATSQTIAQRNQSVTQRFVPLVSFNSVAAKWNVRKAPIASFTLEWKPQSFAPPMFTCRNCGGGDRGRVAIYRPFGEVSLSLNRTVTCMVLKANDRRTSCPCHDEFRGPRSDYVRQVALATTQQQQQI
ncbi:uncharacterized protein TNCV_3680271 [Trichonephila clavipes]|nr:uncharacterized protein TNCV_3680271 [Trichonephila clavipes]